MELGKNNVEVWLFSLVRMLPTSSQFQFQLCWPAANLKAQRASWADEMYFSCMWSVAPSNEDTETQFCIDVLMIYWEWLEWHTWLTFKHLNR